MAVGNLPVEELIQIVADGFGAAHWMLVNQGLTVSDPPTPPLQSELPFTEIVRQEFVDDSLQQARLVMVWRVPGLTKLDHTYALDVLWRQFWGMVARRAWCKGSPGGAGASLEYFC